MGKKLEERVETLEKLVGQLMGKQKFQVAGNIKIGDTFELNGLKWEVLDITGKGYVCLAERLKESMQFDSECNNWEQSRLRKFLNIEFYSELVATVGEENIIPMQRDLWSLDGQTEYGTCEDKVSMLTVDEYRIYRELIPNTGDYWWWTITPDSTKCNGDTRWLRVVSPSGNVGRNSCSNNNGVRPFCIFSSAIFESEE